MKIPFRIIEYLLLLVIKKKITIGNRSYVRWRLFPNLLSSNIHDENWLDDIYESILCLKQGAFVDVGVNIGQTFMKILKIAPDRQYIGFEPQLAPSFVVENFMIENKLRNHIILPIGLSNKYGLVKLRVRGSGYRSMFSAVGSIVDKFRPDKFYTYYKYVFTAPGDKVIPYLELQSIALMKVDVEGGELEVIEGLVTSIEYFMPYILFEVLHHYLVVTDEKLDEEEISFRESRIAKIEKLLRSRGYNIYQIFDKHEIRKIEKIEPKKIVELTTTNYLAVPGNEEEDFLKCIQKYRRITNRST